MDDTRKIAQSLQSIDRTMKLIAQELKRSNDLKEAQPVYVPFIDRKGLNHSSF